MRDQRAEALAQILVRYSTRVGKGDVCVIQSTTAAEVLVQAVYEEVLRAGGLPIMQLSTDGAQAAFFELASDEQLDWIPPTSKWAAENADVRIAIMADVNTRALSRRRPGEAGARADGRKPLMETTMRRAAAGEYRWALTLFPTHAYAGEAGMSLRDYEDFYYARLPGRRRRSGHRVGAPVGRGQAPGGVDRGQGGGAHRGARAPTSRLGVAGRTWIPCDGEHNMPDGEFFTGPVEDSVERRGRVLLPGQLRRPRGGGRAAALRGRQGRGRLGRAGRGLPDRDARHRRRRAPAGRARHRHQLRHRHRHQGDPARREDRRHGPHGDRDELSRRPAARTTRPSTGTWSATCARAARSRSTASSCSATAASRSRRSASPRACARAGAGRRG